MESTLIEITMALAVNRLRKTKSAVFALAATLALLPVTGCESAEEKAAKAAVIAEQQAKYEAQEREAAAEEARLKLQLQSDIDACSAVVDPTRCKEAFGCRNDPEECVYEFGDPSIIIENYADEMSDQATERSTTDHCARRHARGERVAFLEASRACARPGSC